MTGALAIGSDHAGFQLKELLKQYLEEREIPYQDMGCTSTDSCDYPDFAARVAQGVQQGDFIQGILCCGSGIGIAMAANRFAGVRAVVCNDMHTARMSRLHNNANVICFGGRVIAAEYAKEILDVFMNTPFEGGRHTRRVDKMDRLLERESTSC